MSDSPSSDEKNKSQLSHALSLPLDEGNGCSIRKQQSLRIKPVSKPLHDEIINPGIKDRSWSFGNVAKAVGSGVTAFGSGVVQGTKVVGSGVVQGTKVVGSGVVQGTMVVGSGVVSVGSGVVQVGTSVGTGVVQGTKAAGRVTKDVTMAAGKGVFSAGELAVSGVSAVGTATVSAGMAVGAASASAVSDTTKWVKEKSDQLLLPGQEFKEHDLLPGETLESVSLAYGVDIDSIILLNNLESRNVMSGRKLLLPSNEEFEYALGGPLTHCMDHCSIRALKFDDDVVTLKSLCIATDFYHNNEVSLDNNVTLVPVKCIESIAISETSDEDNNAVPELLPPEDILKTFSECNVEENEENCGRLRHQLDTKYNNEGLLFEVNTKNIVVAQSSLSGSQYKIKLVLRREDSDEDKEYIYLVNEENLFILVKFIKLWVPERLTICSNVQTIVETRQFSLDFGEETLPHMPTLMNPSQVLTEDHIHQIHRCLPPQNQNQSWSLQYSTSTDGFSLQNLFRRIANAREPILITIQDHKEVVFGAFITCIPQFSETYIGTGNSWLFSSHGGALEDFKVYPWSGQNEYFYKGSLTNMIIGGGDGKFGLYIDSDLNKGRTDSCITFNNQPLTDHDFNVKCLECWSFV